MRAIWSCIECIRLHPIESPCCMLCSCDHSWALRSKASILGVWLCRNAARLQSSIIVGRGCKTIQCYTFNKCRPLPDPSSLLSGFDQSYCVDILLAAFRLSARSLKAISQSQPSGAQAGHFNARRPTCRCIRTQAAATRLSHLPAFVHWVTRTMGFQLENKCFSLICTVRPTLHKNHRSIGQAEHTACVPSCISALERTMSVSLNRHRHPHFLFLPPPAPSTTRTWRWLQA